MELDWRGRIPCGPAPCRPGRDAGALGACDAAIKTDPYAARAYLWKGQLLRRSGRDGEAAECYGAAIEIDPDGAVAARAHADRGEIARVAGRLDKALAGCSAAIAIDPGLADAHASNASRPLQPGGAARGGAPMPRLQRFAAAGVQGAAGADEKACRCLQGAQASPAAAAAAPVNANVIWQAPDRGRQRRRACSRAP